MDIISPPLHHISILQETWKYIVVIKNLKYRYDL